MRVAVLLPCLLAAAIKVYPEGGASSAARTTGLSQAARDQGETPLVTEQQVYEWVHRWQQRLGLDEWNIQVKVVRSRDLPKGTVANVHWSLSNRRATIKVLHSADSYLPKAEIVKDTELSVVHELIHLTMSRLPLDAVNTELEEQAVKRISAALLSLQRDEIRETHTRSADARD